MRIRTLKGAISYPVSFRIGGLPNSFPNWKSIHIPPSRSTSLQSITIVSADKTKPWKSKIHHVVDVCQVEAGNFQLLCWLTGYTKTRESSMPSDFGSSLLLEFPPGWSWVTCAPVPDHFRKNQKGNPANVLIYYMSQKVVVSNKIPQGEIWDHCGRIPAYPELLERESSVLGQPCWASQICFSTLCSYRALF